MKKLFCFFLVAFLGLQCFSQNEEIIMKLATISEEWKLENDAVVVQKVIEVPGQTKDQLYNAVREFLVVNYNDANSVIQIDNKDDGIIVGKGIFGDIYCTEVFLGSAVKNSFWHIIKCEIKDEKLRVTITMNKYDMDTPASESGGYYTAAKHIEYPITDLYPINTGSRTWAEKKFKTREGYIFYRAILRALNTIDNLQQSVLNNKTDSNSDW